MPDEDKNFRGSLVLDFRKWWRHVKRSILEKVSICSNRGREESLGNDDVSIVCARKYQMVRMT